ncbi:hypothetical protein [Zhongshania sp.]|uniref:hypothetical protein n=1 Tax=Zhongshania sp. TaxID=1971902 RepID=UPI0035645645
MRIYLACLIFFCLPALASASSCQDSDIYTESLLTSAIAHLLNTYGADAVKQPVEKCSAGPGAVWRLALAAHEEDEHFQYYRVVSCTPSQEKQASSTLQCQSLDARRLKYHDQLIDSSNDGDPIELVNVLDCFNEAIRAGNIKISKYNALLDTHLSIPLTSSQDITAISAQPQFKRFTVKALENRYRFSVELDKEFGCFIEPLRSY